MKSKSICSYLIFFSCCVVLAAGCAILNPASTSEAFKRAEEAFAQGKYSEARVLYQRHLSMFPNDISGHTGLGVTLFKMDSLEQAITVFEQYVVNSDKAGYLAHYYHARALHLSDAFDRAYEAYMSYLRKAPKGHNLRTEVAHHIWQSKNGSLLSKVSSKDFVVSNPGESVNSAYNDILPLQSSSDVHRYYFSSDRGDSLLQLKTPYRFFQTNVKDGFWSTATVFQPHELTGDDEILIAITPSGELLLFTRIRQGTATFLADSFSRSEKALPFKRFPAQPEMGDRDVVFFTDSMALFASNRPGGYGGYDIYITRLGDLGWSTPENLGPTVNSAHDDVSPYLALDGRTLYFSSNRPESIGGYDVFKTIYTDNARRWSRPNNLGFGINSGADDLFFKLDRSGRQAVLSSNRPGGLGLMDIYAVVYRQTLTEQMVENDPLSFYDLDHFTPAFESIAITDEAPSAQEQISRTVRTHTVYTNLEQSTLPDSVKAKLDKIIASVSVSDLIELRGHVQSTGSRAFDIYTSYTKADAIATYIKSKGIAESQLIIKGFGSRYLKAQPNLGNVARIDILTLPPQDEVGITLQSDNKDPLKPFNDRFKDITFAVQFVSLSQLYTGDLFDQYEDGFIQRVGSSKMLQYNIGLESKLSEALIIRNAIRRDSPFKDAFINAYLNGVRLNRSEIDKTLQDRHPELSKFMLLSE